jgi:hypothetical protein
MFSAMLGALMLGAAKSGPATKGRHVHSKRVFQGTRKATLDLDLEKYALM